MAKKERTERTIRAEIDAALEEYRANANKWKPERIVESNAQVKSLQTELSDYLSKDAKKCPNCGNPPIGMRRREYVIEVGCPVCSPEEKNGKRVSYSAQGGSREEAVEKWNAGEYLAQNA